MHQDLCIERNWTMGRKGNIRWTTDDRQPSGNFLRVPNGCGEADQHHLRGQVDDDFLPHTAAIRVLDEMHFVEDDDRQSIQRVVSCVDHVAEDFGRHDHDRSIGIDRDVSGQESDLRLPVFPTPVSILLV